MFSIGGKDLVDQEPLKAGDTILCPHCFGMHVVNYSEPPMVLFLFYKCGDDLWMAGVCGRSVMSIISDRKRKEEPDCG